MNKIKRKVWAAFTALSIFVFTFSVNVFALSDTEKGLLLKMYEDGVNTNAHIVSVGTVFRSIGFFFIKLLSSIVDALYIGLQKVISFLTFVNSDGIQALVGSYAGMLKGLLIISIVGLGLWLILKKGNQQANTAQCLLMVLIVFTSMPFLTSTLSSMTMNTTNAIMGSHQQYASGTFKVMDYSSGTYVNGATKKSNDKGTNISTIIASSYIVDLMAQEKSYSSGLPKGNARWRDSEGNPKGLVFSYFFTPSHKGTATWMNIDINEKMDYDERDFEGYEELWYHHPNNPEVLLAKKDLGSEDDWEDWKGGIFSLDWLHTYYYRYQVLSWPFWILELLVTTIVLLFATVRCGQLIFQIAMAEIYTPLIAATDLISGQRTKEALKHFVSLFAAIFLCIALLQVYFVGFGYIATFDFGLGTIQTALLKVLLQLTLALAVIDGPAIIERIIGVDVGVKSGWQMAVGLNQGAQFAKGVSSSVKSGATKAATGTASAAKKAFVGTGNALVGKDNMSKAMGNVKGKAQEAGSAFKDKINDERQMATGGEGAFGFAKNTIGAIKNNEQHGTPLTGETGGGNDAGGERNSVFDSSTGSTSSNGSGQKREDGKAPDMNRSHESVSSRPGEIRRSDIEKDRNKSRFD